MTTIIQHATANLMNSSFLLPPNIVWLNLNVIILKCPMSSILLSSKSQILVQLGGHLSIGHMDGIHLVLTMVIRANASVKKAPATYSRESAWQISLLNYGIF